MEVEPLAPVVHVNFPDNWSAAFQKYMAGDGKYPVSAEQINSNGVDLGTQSGMEETLSGCLVSTPSAPGRINPPNKWLEDSSSSSVAVPICLSQGWSPEFMKLLADHENKSNTFGGNGPIHATQGINGRWKLLHKMGEGSFGEVFKALDSVTGNNVAVKMEDADKTALEHESSIYSALWKTPKWLKGVPRPFYYGSHQGKNVLVMDCLGSCLENFLDICGRSFSVKTVMMIGIQLLDRLQAVHKRHIVHRDIKPQNILMGKGDDGKVVYLVDFGLAKCYRDAATKMHNPYSRERHGVVGTAAYASINSHLGTELSRRDDLISVGYLLVYLFKGNLPWMNVRGRTNTERYENMLKMKEAMSLSEICKGMPRQMEQYFFIVEELFFSEKPDYNRLRGLFEAALREQGHQNDGVFDWM